MICRSCKQDRPREQFPTSHVDKRRCRIMCGICREAKRKRVPKRKRKNEDVREYFSIRNKIFNQKPSERFIRLTKGAELSKSIVHRYLGPQ